MTHLERFLATIERRAVLPNIPPANVEALFDEVHSS
jgi:hypothetical protein